MFSSYVIFKKNFWFLLSSIVNNEKEKFKNPKNIERHFHDDFEEYLEEMLDKF